MAQHDKILFNEWDNVVSAGRNELVFENRNKEYGAFDIRRNYNRAVILGLTYTISAIILIIAIPKIKEWLTPAETAGETEIVPFDPLAPPPPVDPLEPPPPPPPAPPPPPEIKFTPPVVDEQAKDPEPPPPPGDETPIGTKNVEGDPNDEIKIVENPGPAVETVEEVFTIVEEMPSFPGGEAAMYKFIQKNITYPEVEKEKELQGTVFLNFVVDKEGKISEIKVLKGVRGGPGLEQEAIRVVKLMPPWKVGKQNGRPVKVSYNMPFKFTLK